MVYYHLTNEARVTYMAEVTHISSVTPNDPLQIHLKWRSEFTW